MRPANQPVVPTAEAILAHISGSYFSLRLGLALLALAFPVVLFVVGKFFYGIELQPSMSAYFWAATADQCASFPMRTYFVGFLFAIGVGLHVYKGFTQLENTLLNAAAACAVLVALFPTGLTLEDAQSSARIRELFESCSAIEAWASKEHLPVHGAAAVALFALLALVAGLCACKTLDYLPPDGSAALYRRTYRVLAVLLVLSPVTGLVLMLAFGQRSAWVFFAEAASVWTFGAYWLVKSRELARSHLDSRPEQAADNLEQRLEPAPAAAQPAACKTACDKT